MHLQENLSNSLISGAQTVFLGLLLASQIMHLVDRRLGMIGRGQWGYATVFWDSVLHAAAEADTCENILFSFFHVCEEKTLQNT